VLAPEQQLRWRLREIGQDWPRYGFRRAWALLRQEGWKVNRKRVQRIWREEGLRVPPYAPKRRRVGESTVVGRQKSIRFKRLVRRHDGDRQGPVGLRLFPR